MDKLGFLAIRFNYIELNISFFNNVFIYLLILIGISLLAMALLKVSSLFSSGNCLLFQGTLISIHMARVIMAVNGKLLVLLDYIDSEDFHLIIIIIFKRFDCIDGKPSLQKGNNNQALLEQNQ